MVPEGCRRAPTYPCFRRERPRSHRAAPPPRGLGGDLRRRDRAVARPRPRPRDRRAPLLRRPGRDQRLHGRVPGAEPRAGARRRRGALGSVRPRLQRAAREGGESARVARCVDRLLAAAARPHRPDGALHAARPAGHGPVRHAARVRRPRRHPLADPLPDRRPARRLGRGRRDPPQLRAVLDPRADARLLEPRHHRRARRRRATGGLGEREALRVRRLDPRRHDHPGAAARAVAAEARRAAAPADRLARPGGQAGVRADDPGDARPRAHQLQRGHRDVLRVPLHRPDDLAERHRRRVPHLHAPPGNVLGRRGDGAVPGDLAARGPRRHGGIPQHRGHRHSPDRVPARTGERGRRRARRADRAAALRARRVHARPDAGRRRGAGGVLRPGSRSTG